MQPRPLAALSPNHCSPNSSTSPGPATPAQNVEDLRGTSTNQIEERTLAVILGVLACQRPRPRPRLATNLASFDLSLRRFASPLHRPDLFAALALNYNKQFAPFTYCC